MRLGSDRRGRLTATAHEPKAETSRYETYAEAIPDLGQMLYATPDVGQSYQSVALDVNTPTPVCGPGCSSAAYAVESALDELARLRKRPSPAPRRSSPTFFRAQACRRL
ncbi:molybdopterin cofactor-binding domain-containing protein [Streptomyces fuscichromogenes]|uniref:Uncharacterized protein n=1 Tax=Streptomyces fuscichromogenes TaxID=1324013 RepID=A0A917XMH2_9ACTN|nr:molybdopterin cofactor-binding domain-containing protein [Streptomyces fuscichromogenes]GGN39302.1 hypothetical protein GCM10011578_085660 [Streptomyces fuscichromogenes]